MCWNIATRSASSALANLSWDSLTQSLGSKPGEKRYIIIVTGKLIELDRRPHVRLQCRVVR